MTRPLTTPRDEKHARLLQQKRESYARHREKNRAARRAWYHDHQCAVRAQQSRHYEECNAWKYRHSGGEEWWKYRDAKARWHGVLGGPADRLSIINELELRMPSYKVHRPRSTMEWELWDEKGEPR